MLYLILLRHHWQTFVRSLRRQRIWLVLGFGIPLGLYVASALLGAGLFFDKLFRPLLEERSALDLLNEHLLALFTGLFALRFFSQRSPRLKVRPYLHLPIDPRRLIRYVQVASLGSLNNLYPLFFFLPFWLRYVHGSAPPLGASAWLGGIVVCLLLSHALNVTLRLVLDHHATSFALLTIGALGLQIADLASGAEVTAHLSSWLFGHLAAGNGLLLLALIATTVLLFDLSSRTLYRSLREPPPPSVPRQRSRRFTFGAAPIRNLILLELKMMGRTKRPRQYALISVLFATVYTALLLFDYHRLANPLTDAFLGLFASGAFAINYGQLMFSWESRYFDGLLTRDIRPQHWILAKFMTLQGSCLLTFLVSLPLFVFITPELVPLHVTFLFYNAGVTCVLMLALAVRNQKRIDLGQSNLFNYQGFSLLHWLWIIPVLAPPAVLFALLDGKPGTAHAFIASLGLVSMVLAWPWSQLFARQLARRKHRMAAGFRQHGD